MRLAPGGDATVNMASRRQPRVLGRLNGHGRALAERTVKNDALAGGTGKLVQDAPAANIVLKIGIGRVQRAGNRPMFGALALFAIALAASYAPALRAARVEPASALRA